VAYYDVEAAASQRVGQLVTTKLTYTTVAIDRLAYVLFHNPPGEASNSVAILLQIYTGISMPKIIRIKRGLTN